MIKAYRRYLVAISALTLLYLGVLLLYSSKKETDSNLTPLFSPSACLFLGAGNIGYPTIEKLILSKECNKFIVLDLEFNKEQMKSLSNQNQSIEFTVGDIRNISLIQEIFTRNKIDGVVILAAVSRVMWCSYNEELCRDVNTNSIEGILKIMSHLPRKQLPWLVFASSSEVYGAVKKFPVTEATDMEPLNIYGETKKRAEELITSLKTKKPFHRIILRFSSVYGGKFDHSDRLIPSMVSSCLSDRPVIISGGNQEFDFSYIDDVVDSVVKAIKLLKRKQLKNRRSSYIDKFNICSGELTNVGTLFRIVKSLTNSHSALTILNSTGLFPEKYEASIIKSRNVLGFKAQYNINKGLTKYIEGIYKEHLNYLKKRLNFEINYKQRTENINGCDVILLSRTNMLKNTGYVPMHSDSYYNKIVVRDDGRVAIMHPFFENRTFEIKIDQNSRAIALIDEQSKAVDAENPKEVVDWDNRTYPFHIHIHCCPNFTGAPFTSFSPYFLENYKNIRANITWMEKMLDVLHYTENQIKNFSKNLQSHAVESSKIAFDINLVNTEFWAQKSKDICETDCNSIIPCLKSDNCRCVINENCSHRQMKLPKIFSTNVDRKMQVLSIYGRSIGVSWPKVHVLEVAGEFEKYTKKKECVELQGCCCFSMDIMIYNTLKSISVPIEEADIVVVPYFQGCRIHYHRQGPAGPIIQKEINNFKQKYPQFRGKIMTLASHDNGACDFFRYTYFEMEPSKYIQAVGFSEAIMVQTNGDYAFNCYLPHKDIVAPPRTCLTDKLIQKFKAVKPITERKHFIFFEGAEHGTGKNTRKMVKNCKSLFNSPTHIRESDYLEQIGETKFCLLLMGTAGWAPRTSDAIYGGCIPVFVSDHSHQPFSMLLDYSKFSITIRPEEIYSLEQKLRSITDEELLEYQANVMAVRDLFIYKYKSELKEWTPQDFVLRELYLKIRTMYNFQ
jgi:nucleoside-diphosphate-sugar epimerase